MVLKRVYALLVAPLSLKRNHTPSHIKTRELHLVRAIFLFVMRVHPMHFLKRRLA